MPPKIFISYSHDDEVWKDLVARQLRVLQQEDKLDVWDDRQIPVGAEWGSEIETALDEVDAAVLLISSSFLGSDFIRNVEVPRLLARRDVQGILILPLIVESCPWDEVGWLKRLQCRPTDGRELASMTMAEANRAITALVKEIVGLLESMHRESADPLADWLGAVESANAELTAAFEHRGAPELLDHVYVELALADRELVHGLADPERLAKEGRPDPHWTLDALLRLEPSKFSAGLITRRWLLFGDPGSGKTTLLRHLAWKLARAQDRPWVPVFASLPLLLSEVEQGRARPLNRSNGANAGRPSCASRRPCGRSPAAARWRSGRRRA